MKNMGFLYATLAYLHWGVVPIYWKQIQHVDSTEIVMHRMIWAFVFVFLWVCACRQFQSLTIILKNRNVILRLFIASILIAANWAIYIWAVNNDRMVEASMGYFINPLISVALGMIIFGERLRKLQALSISLAALGVLSLVIVFGEVPIIALSLALSFSVYGAVKKSLHVPATHGLAIETGFLVLPAIAYVIYLGQSGQAQFGVQLSSDAYLLGSGIMTLIPLLLFSSAAQKISLTALGMLQYIGPTAQLLIAIFIYHEAFDRQDAISFGLVWVAIVVFSIDQVSHQRSQNRALVSPVT